MPLRVPFEEKLSDRYLTAQTLIPHTLPELTNRGSNKAAFVCQRSHYLN